MSRPIHEPQTASAFGFVGLVIILTAIAAFTLFARTASAAGLLVADGGFGGRLEIKEHNVDVVINNGVAVTTVEQIFVNTENRTVEALYTFPVPQSASVADFSMWINGQEMIGEVVEKQRAREIYNSYKRQARPLDPGLLEQVDYKTFELRIYPIMAKAEQRIRIVYYQQLDFENDWATYVYPLATTTSKKMNSNVTGRFSLRMQVKSEIPLTGMTSPSHTNDFAIVKHDQYMHEASLEATGNQLNRDVVLSFQTQRPRTGMNIITSKPADEDGYFMLTLTAGQELAKFKEGSKGRDYIFLLDISGSMAQQSKLNLSQNTLDSFIRSLDEKDRFELITFNIQPAAAFRELRTASEENKEEGARILQTQTARGGTRLTPAMTMAYQYVQSDREAVIVLMSDGMNETQERQELISLLSSKPANVRVFTIGVGNNINRPLLSQMAQHTGGLAAFLSDGDDFRRQAEAFRRKLLMPVATDVKITFEDGQVYDVEGADVTTLYHGAPIRIYGRYKPNHNESTSVRITANILGHSYDQKVNLPMPANDMGNPEIERMWAWHRVDRLLKQADAAGSRQSVMEEIVRLGEGYSIVTEHTSFIVLENDQEYQRWNLKRRNALRVQRDRAAQQAVRNELDNIRNASLQNLGPEGAAKQSEQLASAQPVQTNPTTPSLPQQPQPQQREQPAPAPSNNRGVDLPLPRGAGGAMNPALVLISLGMTGGLLYTSIRKKNRAA